MAATPYPLPCNDLHDAVVERFIEAALETEKASGIGTALNDKAIAENSWLSHYDKDGFKKAFNNIWPLKRVPINGMLRLLRAIEWAHSDDDTNFFLNDAVRAWGTMGTNARHETFALALAHAWFAQYTHLSEAEFIATMDTLLVDANVSGADIPDGGALSAYRLLMYYGVASESSAETQRVEAVSDETRQEIDAPTLDDIFTPAYDAQPIDEPVFDNTPIIESQDVASITEDAPDETISPAEEETLTAPLNHAVPPTERAPSVGDDQPVQPFVAPPPDEATANILSDFGTQKKAAAFDHRPTGRTRWVKVNAGETSDSIPSSDEGTPEFKRGERPLLGSANAQVEKSSDTSDTRKVRRTPFARLTESSQAPAASDGTINEAGTSWSRRTQSSDANTEARKWEKSGIDRYRRSSDNTADTPARGGDRQPVDNRVYGPRAQRSEVPSSQNIPAAVLTLTLPDGSQITIGQALINEIKAEYSVSTLEAIALLQSRFMKQSGQTHASANDENPED